MIVLLILCLILKKNTALLQLSVIRVVQLLMLLGFSYHRGKELFTVFIHYCISLWKLRTNWWRLSWNTQLHNWWNLYKDFM